MSEALKVAVRCRPFNQREIDRDAKLVIDMTGATTIIKHPDTGEEKKFTFDYSYWSHDDYDTDENGYMTQRPGGKYADQQTVFNDLGMGLLENAWKGFNCCVFAYGQTGSGKSYSIVGYGENKGVIPLTCAELFRRVDATSTDTLKYRVQVTMLEIYNEKLRDLLNPKTAADQLKIRTNASGMYVENIREVAVDSYEAIERQMDVGTKNRTVGATQMNATSSRAHTVFTINFTKIDSSSEMRASINLVDLAGSERATSTGATGDRLKEGAAINQSLSNLGLVISALAEQANHPKKKVLVPYRASKLTMLLQNALGGNSKTVMVAALSPADINYEETLSTLRYADRAKQIKTIATVQENPTDRLIRELKEENSRLQKLVGAGGGAAAPSAGLGEADADADAGEAAGGSPPLTMVTPADMRAAIEEAVNAVPKASAAERLAAIEFTLKQYKRKYAEGESIPDADMMEIVETAIYQLDCLTPEEKAAAAAVAKDAANWRNGGRFRYLLQSQQKSLARARFGDAIARVVLTSASRRVKWYAVIEATRRMKAVSDVKSARAQLEANEKKIADLQMSWEAQLEQSRKQDAERVEQMRALGFVELSAEQMKTTASLVNLSDDPLMSGQLYFWLTKAEMTVGAAAEADIVLAGLGVSEQHCKLERAADGAMMLTPLRGTTFMNGKELKGSTKLEHNARLIIGNTNVLRYNDPLAAAEARAAGASAKAVFDWDFAQKELSDALGATVSLKVEEEIAKEKAILEAKSAELEARFAKERETMLAEVERLKKEGGKQGQEAGDKMLQELDSKIANVAEFRKQREASIAGYRRDLIRLEETLVRLNPVVGEANAMASQMGRKIGYTIKLVTNIRERVNVSPLEELWAEKTTDVMLRAVMTGHTDSVQRAWLWTVDEFYDRVFTMREQFALHLRSQPTHAKHVVGDPFWAAPKPEVIGKAFLYLTPLAHSAAFSDWLPIVDSHGKEQGSLKVSAKCTKGNFVDGVPPRADPASLDGESLFFALRIDSAKGLIGDATTSTFVRFNWSGEPTPRTTDVCEGRTTTPQYNYRENFEIKACDAQILRYLTTDAICFEVFGQAEDIPEGVVKPAQIEQPPEIFDFFVSIDLHEAMDETRGSAWIEAAWEKGMTRDGKPALFITQNRARRIVVSVSQQQSSFLVSRFAHVWLGNLRTETHDVWDPAFIPLSIVSQSRNGERFELICEWFSQFDSLNKPEAKDKLFYLDVKIECIELERLVMEEPLVLTRRLNVKVCDAAQQESMTSALTSGLAALVGGAKKAPQAQTTQVRRIMSVGEGKAVVADTDRIRRLEEHMQHYMGAWDITGEAVDIAMAALKSSAIADTGKEIKRQLHDMDDGLRQLSSFMLDEQQRQLEILHRDLGKSDAAVAAAIAKKKQIATTMAAAANVALQEARLETEDAVAGETAAQAKLREEKEAESRAATAKLREEKEVATAKQLELEAERMSLHKELAQARADVESAKAEAAAAKLAGAKSQQKSSSMCLTQ